MTELQQNSFYKRGNNGYKKNYIIKQTSDKEHSEYQLKNFDNKTFKLELQTDEINQKILYYEFNDDKLFIIINWNSFTDWISFKSFDVHTGQVIFSDEGQIPCVKEIDNTVDWKLGNDDCEWINFKSNNISYFRQDSIGNEVVDGMNIKVVDFKIFSFNWQSTQLDTIAKNIPPNFDATTGGNKLPNNIKFKTETNNFEY